MKFNLVFTVEVPDDYTADEKTKVVIGLVHAVGREAEVMPDVRVVDSHLQGASR